MKKIVIIKLDTPCTLTEQAWRVPTAEPVNFAKALIDAYPDETIDVCMIGQNQKSIEVGLNGTIRTVAYFGDPKSIKDEFDEYTKVILWQGRPCYGSNVPKSPNTIGSKLTLISPYSAGDYERISMYKIWQVMMYNLFSSNIIPDEAPKYFLLTDLRAPLIDMHKIDPIAVPKSLPKNMVLLTQAAYAEQYLRWYSKYFNGCQYDEVNIADYVYEFKSAMYLPLHSLPLYSHEQFAKDLTSKHGDSIFQVQSLTYIDDYRKKKLGEALKFVSGNCTIHGRFRAAERGFVVANYPEFSDKLLDKLIDNSDKPYENFLDSAKILSDYQASLIVTDQRYARFGLCPNRFVEAIAVNTIPLVVKDALDLCDSTIQDIVAKLNICPSKTEFVVDSRPGYTTAIRIYDNNDNLLDLANMQQILTESKAMLKAQLHAALCDFINSYN